MGLFESIMSGLNIGGCSIEVHTDMLAYPQATNIKGQVVVRGGKIPQEGSAIKIELEEFWTESRGSGKNSRRVTVYRTQCAQSFKNFSISPGEVQSYDFSLALPLNSRLSTSSTGWDIKVSIDIPNAIDPVCKAKLLIEPAKEFLAIVEACRGLKFSIKSNSWEWTKDSDTTYFRLLPSEEMYKEFDYMAFNLCQSFRTGGVVGDILFNLQEKSFTDYLKSMLFMDRIQKTFILGREQIFLPDGSINHDGIICKIKPLLDEIIKSRNEYDGKIPESIPLQLEDESESITSPDTEKKDYDIRRTEEPESRKIMTPKKEFDPKDLDAY